jgi:hypothetical protein
MSKALRGPSAPEVEVDQRSPYARLRLEQIEGLLVPGRRRPGPGSGEVCTGSLP